MTFTEFGPTSRANVPEHNRLRGLDQGDPHPQYADATHTHASVVYYDTGSDSAPDSAYSDLSTPATLSLPAGMWLIQAKGWFEFSTGTARTYQARIYDATGAAELDSITAAGLETDGSTPFSLGAAATLTAASTVRIENKVSVVDGTQLTFASIWATPVTAIL